jgi:plastocyanin
MLAATVVVAALMADSSQQATRGAIKGHIKLSGRLPGNPIIRMRMDPKCAQANAGKQVVQETVVAALDGSLANVFVYLSGTIPQTAIPAAPVVIDQRACLYRPRVVGARAGQVLQVKNSDDLLHNVHSLSAKGNSFNVSQPKAGMVQQFKLKDEEVMLQIRCDVHSWMTTYVGVVTNPYFAVSNELGTFNIANVPSGSYTLHTWHERYGLMKQSVRVQPGTTTTVDFVYSGNEKPPGAD